MKKFIFLIIFFMIFSCTPGYKKHYKKAFRLLIHKKDSTIDNNKAAIEEFDEAIKYAVMATYEKGNALKKLGIKMSDNDMYLEAVKYLKQAAAVNPADSEIYYYLGLCYANYSKLVTKSERDEFINNSEEAYRIGLSINKNNVDIIYASGILFGFIKKDYNKGIDYLKRVIQIIPDHEDAHFALANLYFQNNKLSFAENHYESLLRILDEDSEKYKIASENLETVRRSIR